MACRVRLLLGHVPFGQKWWRRRTLTVPSLEAETRISFSHASARIHEECESSDWSHEAKLVEREGSGRDGRREEGMERNGREGKGRGREGERR